MTSWFRRLGRRDRDGELGEEIRAHLEMAIRDRVDRGEPRAQAEAAARRELGNVATIQEVTREMWGGMWLERLAQDLRYGVRLLRRNPGFTAVAVLSLALGIGANTAIFQVINAVRLRALPVPNPGEIAEIRLVDPSGMRGSFNSWHPSLTNPIWEQIRERQQGFSSLLATGATTFNLATGGESRPAQGLWVSGGLFSMLGVQPAAGRVLTGADDRRGCPARAVLSYPFWQREYGGDPSVVGRTITLQARPVEIVGVAQPGFFGLEVGRSFDVALPICAQPIVDGGVSILDSGTTWWLMVMGRLKPGWTIQQATAQLNTISPGLFRSTLPSDYPSVSVQKYLDFKLAAYGASSGISGLREQYEAPLWLLLGTAALVLVIACANLANLLLARASARQREMAVRLGLGASRGRVVRQLLTESLLLAGAGAAGGAILARTLSTALVSFIKTADQGVVLDLGVDWRVLGFTAALAIATCVLFGLVPALKATRIGADSVLKISGRGQTAGREGVGMRRALVVCQVALSLVLLIGAFLFARSLQNLLTLDPGFRAEGVMVAMIDMRQLGMPVEGRRQAQREILTRLGALPGVESAAQALIVPISGNGWGNAVWTDAAGSRRTVSAAFNQTSSGYFRTLGIPLLAGRDFDEALDTTSAPLVAIVNEAFAREVLNGGDPVGTRFTVEATPTTPERTFHVVGLVRDAKYTTLREDMRAGVYLAGSQDPQPRAWARLVVRSSLPPETVTAAITRSLAEWNPRIGVTYSVLTSQIADTLVRERLMATLSGFFGGLAAVLTLVGLYGVIAYTVARRTKEIGIRIALGATSARVVSMVLREAGVLVALGIAGGLVLAYAGGKAASTLLFGLEPNDPVTLGVAVVGLAAVALAASYAPALRAARIEPNTALRID
jgi:putative ABC transport system permease protein